MAAKLSQEGVWKKHILQQKQIFIESDLSVGGLSGIHYQVYWGAIETEIIFSSRAWSLSLILLVLPPSGISMKQNKLISPEPAEAAKEAKKSCENFLKKKKIFYHST